jgi:hypothetical protein
MKPPCSPFSSRSVWKSCSNCYGKVGRFQMISLRHCVNATANCDFSAPFLIIRELKDLVNLGRGRDKKHTLNSQCQKHG